MSLYIQGHLDVLVQGVRNFPVALTNSYIQFKVSVSHFNSNVLEGTSNAPSFQHRFKCNIDHQRDEIISFSVMEKHFFGDKKIAKLVLTAEQLVARANNRSAWYQLIKHESDEDQKPEPYGDIELTVSFQSKESLQAQPILKPSPSPEVSGVNSLNNNNPNNNNLAFSSSPSPQPPQPQFYANANSPLPGPSLSLSPSPAVPSPAYYYPQPSSAPLSTPPVGYYNNNNNNNNSALPANYYGTGTPNPNVYNPPNTYNPYSTNNNYNYNPSVPVPAPLPIPAPALGGNNYFPNNGSNNYAIMPNGGPGFVVYSDQQGGGYSYSNTPPPPLPPPGS